jgi:ElaB/YqjD/DUF883 family membrane-anchored ribosome-binding protein
MSTKGFLAFLAGAAAGAAAIWLAKTDEGRETIDQLKKKAASGLDELENAVENFKDKAEATAKAAVETVEEKVGK